MSSKLTEYLNDLWKSLNINRSDNLLIHSNIKPLLRYFIKKGIKIKPDQILDSLLNYISVDGNLIFPAFNFQSIERKYFSISETTSEMGLLSETARLHKDAIRTKHPVYSFTCFGKISKSLINLENFTSYGMDSPFQKMREINTKILILDLIENRSMTFYHHVEEILEVSYRFRKKFKFNYHNEKSNYLGEKTFSIYVRDIDKKVVTNVNPMGELLKSKGLYKLSNNIGVNARIISSESLFSETEKIIKNGLAKGMLYEINN